MRCHVGGEEVGCSLSGSADEAHLNLNFAEVALAAPKAHAYETWSKDVG